MRPIVLGEEGLTGAVAQVALAPDDAGLALPVLAALVAEPQGGRLPRLAAAGFDEEQRYLQQDGQMAFQCDVHMCVCVCVCLKFCVSLGGSELFLWYEEISLAGEI